MAQMKLLSVCLTSMLGSAAAWGRCSAGPVGSCAMMSCLPTRGPTQCVGHSCMCMEGYCDAGDHFADRCEAQVGTCNLLPCSWNHGGLLAVRCISGACLCHMGYHSVDGICTRGWWPPTMLAAMNSTQRAAALEVDANLPTLSRSQMESVAKHLAGFGAVPAIAMALWVLVPRLRRRRTEAEAESQAATTTAYEPLLDGM